MSNVNMPWEEREYLRYLRDEHFKAQHGLCHFCNVPMTPADAPEPKPDTTVTIEHIKPRRDGGGSNWLNTVAACLGCNKKREGQRQRGKRSIPVVKLARKPNRFLHWTYAYTVPSKPDVLVLCNLKLDRDVAMLELRRMEGQPITLKDAQKVLTKPTVAS